MAAIRVVFAARVGHVKHDRLVSQYLDCLIRLNSNLSVVKHFLVELERYRDLTDVSESECLLTLASNNYISEVADVSGDVNVIKVDSHSSKLNSRVAAREGVTQFRESIRLLGLTDSVNILSLRHACVSS